MNYKYKQKLPAKVEKDLDAYIERIKNIQWFKPSPDLKRETVDIAVKAALSAFGIKASIEYRPLKTPEDYDAARDAARDAAWDAAWGAARDAARGAAWGAAWDAAWGAAWGAAWDAARDAAWDAARDAARYAALDAAWDASWDAAWGAADILALNLDEYKKKYPNGNFINLIPLYEAGLYPVGVVNGKFIIYVPASKQEFPNELI